MFRFWIALTFLATMFAQPSFAAFKVEVIGVQGFPTGGTTGQFLKKSSATDYDTAWASVFISSLTSIGSSANANGMTVSSGVLNLEPASASFGGVVTTGTQTMAGAKTFSTSVTSPIMVPTTIKITTQASDPGTPAEGWLYFNSVSHVLKFYNGTTWKTVTTD